MHYTFIYIFILTVWMVAQPVTGQQLHPSIHVVLLGDSNTWLGGDDCSQDKGWNTWFNRRFQPASCRSYARSGATWTNTNNTMYDVVEDIGVIGDNNVIYNQVNRLIVATKQGRQPLPDLLVIAAGTNDAWFENRRPHAFQTTAADRLCDDSLLLLPPSQVLTLQQSIRYSCLQLHRAFPDACIVLLTPLQSTAVSDEKIRLAGDLIERCAHELGIDVIRQDVVCCIKSRQERKKKKYTYDGTHTSVSGARLIGYLLADSISKIIENRNLNHH